MSPDEFTNQEFFLDVGDGHQLYVQDWGNSHAKLPIINVHGGPGLGTSDGSKQRFDPSKQRVIFFDQRGSGKSLPEGSTDNNTTDDMVGDIDKLADHLKIKKFILCGGSWGSSLALIYGIRHPDRVHSMVLWGIYAAGKNENDYLLNGGWKSHYPDLWEAYLERTPVAHHDKPGDYHVKQALSGSAEEVKKSTYAMQEVEYALSTLDDRHTPQDYETFDPFAMKIELHYLGNGCFIPENYIMNNAHKLHMPIWLVQGRYDMVCPPVTAYELSQKLPNGNLTWTVGNHYNDRSTYDVVRSLMLQLSTGQS